jgi:acetyl-CoA carboxylase biotin carboxylase subunit
VLRDALARTTIDGIATTIGLHAAIVADPDFATGAVPTGWLPEPARA